tara:strand:- start:452 stop:637 length:186 start_codon:yes stop_codon:yes gene_type:complete
MGSLAICQGSSLRLGIKLDAIARAWPQKVGMAVWLGAVVVFLGLTQEVERVTAVATYPTQN